MLVLTAGEGEALVVQQIGDAAAAPDGDRRGARGSGGAVAGASGVVALVTFMVPKTDDVTVEFQLWQFGWPVWLLILVSALIARSSGSASACSGGVGGAGSGARTDRTEPLTAVSVGGLRASTEGRP
jgi:hypothetical protein